MQSLWRDARVEPLDGRTRREKNIRWMIFDWTCPVVGSGVQRSDRPCWGIQGGKAPLASLAKAEKPKGFFGAAVRCGLPQCETCLITHRRFRSLGGRRRVICGFAICPGGRCLMLGREYEYRFRQEVIFCSMIWQKEKGHNSPVDCLLLRSVQVSTDPGGNGPVRKALVSFPVNRHGCFSSRASWGI